MLRNVEGKLDDLIICSYEYLLAEIYIQNINWSLQILFLLCVQTYKLYSENSLPNIPLSISTRRLEESSHHR